MPLVTSIMPVKLNDKIAEDLKKGIAEILKRVADKDESWLMIRFEEEETLYFRGVKIKDGAIVDIKVYGTLSSQIKKQLVSEICKLYKDITPFDPKNIYVIIQEFADSSWGWNGSTLG